MGIAIMLFIILVPLFLWSYFCPEDSLLLGKRWQFEEEPEISKEAILVCKAMSIIGIVVVSLILIFTIYSHFI